MGLLRIGVERGRVCCSPPQNWNRAFSLFLTVFKSLALEVNIERIFLIFKGEDSCEDLSSSVWLGRWDGMVLFRYIYLAEEATVKSKPECCSEVLLLQDCFLSICVVLGAFLKCSSCSSVQEKYFFILNAFLKRFNP